MITITKDAFIDKAAEALAELLEKIDDKDTAIDTMLIGNLIIASLTVKLFDEKEKNKHGN